jgi:hypothetical protein
MNARTFPMANYPSWTSGSLFGRLHIDVQNAMMYDDYGLDGIWELARVSGLPLQVAARGLAGYMFIRHAMEDSHSTGFSYTLA